MNTSLPTPREDLRTEVGVPPQSEQGLIAWIPKAALLAALGEKPPLAQFPTHLAHLRLDDARWLALLKERLQEAAWDFRHAEGEDFGFAHLDAQEWHLAYRLLPAVSGRSWSMAEARVFEAWADDAVAHKVLDEVAQAAILNWRETWGVEDAFLLTAVRTPMTEVERWVGVGLMGEKGEKAVAGRVGGKLTAYAFPTRVNRPAMAAAGSDDRLEECAELRFISPNGQYEASIFLPRYTQDGKDALRLEIYATANNGDASALKGAGAVLTIGQHAATATLDADACCVLKFPQKLEGKQEIELLLQDAAWTFFKAVTF